MLAKLFFAIFAITASVSTAAEYTNDTDRSTISCCQCTTSQFSNCQSSESTSSVMRIVEGINDEFINKTIVRMQKMSRIVTAIALQKDLYSGDVDPEKLVPELFRLGNITTSDLKYKLYYEVPLKLIRDLPGKLIKRDRFKKVQEKLKLLEEIRKLVEKTGDFEKWENRETFISEITDIKDDGIDLSLVNTVYKHVKALPVELDLISSLSLTDKSTSEDIAIASAYMKNLKKTMENLVVSIDALAASDGKPWGYKSIDSADKALLPILSLITAIEKAKEHTPKLLEHTSGEEDDFRILLENLMNITEVSESISFLEVEKLAEMIVISNPTDWLGLPNGYSDLELVFEDLEDSWVRKVIRSDKLISTLNPLKELTPNFRKVGIALAEIRNYPKPKVKEFVDYIRKIRQAPIDGWKLRYSSSLHFEELWKCKDQFESLPKFKKNESYSFFLLDHAMKNLSGYVQEFLNLLYTEKVRENLHFMIFNSTVIYNDVESLKAASYSLQGYARNLMEVFLQADKVFAKIEIPRKEAQKVLDDVYLFDRQLVNFTPFHPLLQCFKDIGSTKVDLVEEGLNILEPFGDEDDIESGYDALEKAYNLISDLDDITRSLSSMKDSLDADQETLKSMPKIYDEWREFAEAMGEILKLKRTIDIEDQMELIIDNTDLISKNWDLVGDSEKNQLENLVSLKSSIPKMLEGLKNWKKNFTTIDSASPPTNLSAYSDIFLSADSVNGIKMFLKYVIPPVDTLVSKVDNPDSKNRLVSVKTILERMEEIDVWFLKLYTCHIVSERTLLSIDNFFASFDEKHRETLIAKGEFIEPQSSTTLAPDHTLLYAGIVVSVIGFLIFIGVILCCVVGGKKKKKEADLEGDKSDTAKTKSDKKEKSIKKPPTEEEISNKFHNHLINHIESVRLFSEDDHFTRFKNFFEFLLMAIDSETKTGSLKLVKKYARETRALIPLHASNRFKLSDFGDRFLNDYIHASIVSFLNGFQMILTQGPQKTGEKKLSTIEKFWWMARGSEYVVMLCDWAEPGSGVVNCDVYFPDDVDNILEFRGLKLTCTKKNLSFGNKLIRRTILVSFDGEVEFSIEHIQYTDWHDNSGPHDTFAVTHILNEVRISKKPVIVHCSNGVGRSGSFAFMELGLQTLYSTGSLTIGESLYQLRSMRALAVEKPLHLGFCTAVIHHFAHRYSDSRLRRTYQYALDRHNRLNYPVISLVSFVEQESSSDLSDESDTEFGKPIVKPVVKKRGWF